LTHVRYWTICTGTLQGRCRIQQSKRASSFCCKFGANVRLRQLLIQQAVASCWRPVKPVTGPNRFAPFRERESWSILRKCAEVGSSHSRRRLISWRWKFHRLGVRSRISEQRVSAAASNPMSLLSIFAGRNKWRSGGDTAFPWDNGRRSGNRKSIEKENAASLRFDPQFHRMLWRERKRSERSNKTLLLLVISCKPSIGTQDDNAFLRHAVNCVIKSVRDTDLAGWIETDAMFGVLFTELGDTEIAAATNAIRAKVMACLQKSYDANQLTEFLVSFHRFPDGWEGKHNEDGRYATPSLHPGSFDRRAENMIAGNSADARRGSFSGARGNCVHYRTDAGAEPA
jgi:hypothetical protein